MTGPQAAHICAPSPELLAPQSQTNTHSRAQGLCNGLCPERCGLRSGPEGSVLVSMRGVWGPLPSRRGKAQARHSIRYPGSNHRPVTDHLHALCAAGTTTGPAPGGQPGGENQVQGAERPESSGQDVGALPSSRPTSPPFQGKTCVPVTTRKRPKIKFPVLRTSPGAPPRGRAG